MYDDRMLLHRFNEEEYFERPERVMAIWLALCKAKLGLKEIKATEVTKE